MFTIISFYTVGNGYEREAERLRRSCERLDLVHQIEAVHDHGSWLENAKHKAEFVRSMRDRITGPMVWLDADAEVMAYPTAYDVLDGTADFAAHWKDGWELLSSAFWMADNASVQRLLDLWVKANADNPRRKYGDQENLSDSVDNCEGLRVHRLPAPYALIFDTMRDQGPPIILQHQASRRLRRKKVKA